MIIMKKTITTTVLIGLLACNQQNKTVENKTEVNADTTIIRADTSSVYARPAEREVTAKSGKIFVVAESHPKGMSLSDISVYFKGDTATALKVYDKDPVSKVINADLDGNGFDEVYVITTAAGSGSYGNVHGFASNKDKSLSMVHLPELADKDLEKGGQFEGYEGHDLFEINGKQLVRTFPVDKKTRKIIYELKQSETGYTLKLISSKVE